jgi:hypothetical protein
VTGGWSKLHKAELHNLYSSPSIIRMIESRRMRWAGHVARMGAKRMENLMEIQHEYEIEFVNKDSTVAMT